MVDHIGARRGPARRTAPGAPHIPDTATGRPAWRCRGF